MGALAERMGYRLGAVLAPGFTGRRAAAAFGATRPLGTTPDDLAPLGARKFHIDGCLDVRVGYLWGTGDRTALLVHGWGVDSSSMHTLVPPLRELGYRVAAFDAPGHGVAPGRQATIRQVTESVRTVLTTLGNVRIVVAHSLGAIATVATAADAPTGLEAVVLLAPACTLAAALDRWAADRPWVPPRVVAQVADELAARNGVPVSHWDIRSLGRRLDVPVLVAHDPADDLVPFTDAQAVAAALRHAQVVTVPGVGHSGILLATATKQAISTFLTGIGAREESCR